MTKLAERTSDMLPLMSLAIHLIVVVWSNRNTWPGCRGPVAFHVVEDVMGVEPSSV